MESLGTPRCNEVLEFHEEGDAVAVCAPRLQRRDLLDRTDAWVLILADGTNSVEAIVDAIAKAKRISRDDAVTRVRRSIDALTRLGYLETDDLKPAPAADAPPVHSDRFR